MSSSSTRTLRLNGQNDTTVKISEIYSIMKSRTGSNSKILTKESTKNTWGCPTFSCHPRMLIDGQFCPRLKRESLRYSTLTPTTHLHLPIALIMEITATMTLTRVTVHLRLPQAFQHPCWIRRQMRIPWNLLSMDKAIKMVTLRKRKPSKTPKNISRAMFRNIHFTLSILRCG